MAELRVKSEIAGSVWKIEVTVGDKVDMDDPLIVLELMKMEIPLLAPKAGTVMQILVTEGEAIAEGDVAVVLGSGRLPPNPAGTTVARTRRPGGVRLSRQSLIFAANLQRRGAYRPQKAWAFATRLGGITAKTACHENSMLRKQHVTKTACHPANSRSVCE